ncbi:hypothetical protein J7J23_01930 [bacterium]|nr:hypothetical protein [bacterium]
MGNETKNGTKKDAKKGREAKRGLILITTIVVMELILFFPVPLDLPNFPLVRFIVALVVLSVLVYFVWAPNNLYFTKIKEGTAKNVFKAGAFHKTLIQWKGRTLNDEGEVVEGKEWHLLGGFRYYGFWPIKGIDEYQFSWINFTQESGAQRHPKETIDYVLLKQDVYWAIIKNAEDKNLVRLDVEIILTIRITNPRKARFEIENWLEAVINRIGPVVVKAMTKKSFHELIAEKASIGDDIMATREMEKLKLIFSNEYGVDLMDLQVEDINPTDEKYMDAILKPWLAGQEAISRVKETAVPLVEMVGILEKFMGRQKALELAGDLIKMRMSLDKNARVDVHVDGAEGIEKAGLDLIAAWQKLMMDKKTPAKEKPKKPAAEMTEKEEEEFLRQLEREEEEVKKNKGQR